MVPKSLPSCARGPAGRSLEWQAQQSVRLEAQGEALSGGGSSVEAFAGAIYVRGNEAFSPQCGGAAGVPCRGFAIGERSGEAAAQTQRRQDPQDDLRAAAPHSYHGGAPGSGACIRNGNCSIECFAF